MAEETTKLPGKAEEKENSRPAEWRPLESLRRELDRLFDDFGVGSWRSPSARGVFDVEPFWRGEVTWGKAPAVDIAEHEKAYEITVELPGMDESNIEAGVFAAVIAPSRAHEQERLVASRRAPPRSDHFLTW